MTIETAQAGNWVAETFTNVDDYLALGGTSGGYVRFRDAFKNGDTVFYSAVDDDNNRESGVATFQDGRLVDRNVTAVLRSGVYEEGESLTPVSFRGTNRIVSGTFNQYAFEKLWSHIYNEDNPHDNPFGVPEAPADGKQYARQNESWDEIVALGTGAIPDAPVDGKIYGRENALWKEVYIDTAEFDEIIQEIEDKLEEIANGTITAGELNVAGNAIAGSYRETFKAVQSSSGVTTINCEEGNVFEHRPSENTTLEFINPPESGEADVTLYPLDSTDYRGVSANVDANTSYGRGLTLSSDGTKLFVVDAADKQIRMWSVASAFNLDSGVSYVSSFSVETEDTSPTGVKFNADGTKMFVTGKTTASIYQYSLSVGFDVTTASYDSVSFSVVGQDPTPEGLAFNVDGTKMYVAGEQRDTIHQYALGTGFNLSTASYTSKSFSAQAQDSDISDVSLSLDGTKVFVLGNATDTVYQYDLSTAFDASTASYSGISFSFNPQMDNPQGVAFSGDGLKMFVVGFGKAPNWSGNGPQPFCVYQYTTGTSFLPDSTAYGMTLRIAQDSQSSGYSVTWPTGTVWPTATPPTLSAGTDVFVFFTNDGGTTWYGFVSGQEIA